MCWARWRIFLKSSKHEGTKDTKVKCWLIFVLCLDFGTGRLEAYGKFKFTECSKDGESDNNF